MISWNCKDEKMILDFPYIQLLERHCVNALTEKGGEGEAHRFYVIRSRDWCNIIPITEEGKIVLIKQFRAGTMGVSLEFPGGVVESEDSDVQATALRELLEETGYEPTPQSRCKILGVCHPNPALQDNRAHSLIVGPVKKITSQNLDPSEDIEIVETEISELPRLIQEGQFSHALMLNTLFYFLMQDSEVIQKMATGLSQFSR